MISSAARATIFKSLPKSVAINLTNYAAHVEYAHIADVSKLLKTSPIVVTLRYFGDRPDGSAPANHVLGYYISDDGDVVYQKGERSVETLSVNVYSKGSGKIPAADLVREYMGLLKLWAVVDLRGIDGVTYRGRSQISDLSLLEDGSERRHIDIQIGHTNRKSVTVSTIDTVNEEVEMNDS